MIEFLETAPEVEVAESEYLRLLGYPRGRVLEGRACELATQARAWFQAHGRPWIYARECSRLDIAEDAVLLDGVPFTAVRLRSLFRQAGAHSAILVAASAGPELEAEAQRLWREEKPDEYFFLEVYGSAVTEHLVTLAGSRLCDWAEEREMAVLPHSSPGYSDWDIAEQQRLLDLIAASPGNLPGPLEVFESGMLRPKKSLLAVFGITHHTDRLARLTDLVPCESCTMPGCRYRRAPHRMLSPLEHDAKYSVNAKALQRWSRERLTLEQQPDGSVAARFRYDGTTCSNMGRPLAFDYHVILGPRALGYPIDGQRCVPAPGDTGHSHMCQFQTRGAALLGDIAGEHPLAGMPLNEVLRWPRPAAPAGCYCESQSREHKWGLVLETIHYALVQLEKNGRTQ